MDYFKLKIISLYSCKFIVHGDWIYCSQCCYCSNPQSFDDCFNDVVRWILCEYCKFPIPYLHLSFLFLQNTKYHRTTYLTTTFCCITSLSSTMVSRFCVTMNLMDGAILLL